MNLHAIQSDTGPIKPQTDRGRPLRFDSGRACGAGDPTQRGACVIELLLSLAVATVMLWGVVSIDQWLRGTFARQETQSTLKELRMALTVYHDQQGDWPPGPTGEAIEAMLNHSATASMVRPLRFQTGVETGMSACILDGYGQPVHYVIRRYGKGQIADFASCGPDGQLGDLLSDQTDLNSAAMDDVFGLDQEYVWP